MKVRIQENSACKILETELSDLNITHLKSDYILLELRDVKNSIISVNALFLTKSRSPRFPPEEIIVHISRLLLRY